MKWKGEAAFREGGNDRVFIVILKCVLGSEDLEKDREDWTDFPKESTQKEV